MGRAVRSLRARLKSWSGGPGLVLLVRSVLWLGSRLPRRWGQRVGGALGWIGYYVIRRDPRLARENLKRVFGEQMSDREIHRLARAVMVHHGRSVLETVYLQGHPPEVVEDWVRFQGWERMEQALALGRGAIIISGHLGNWELMAAAIGRRVPLRVIARSLDHPDLDRLMTEVRGRFGIRSVLRDSEDERDQILEVFQRNEVLGCMIDQDSLWTRGVFVPFFGRMAYTPSGPAALALKHDVPVVCLSSHRESDGGFLVEVEGPIRFEESGNREKDVEQATARLTGIVEGWIRRHPEQWSWFHRRWRTDPERLENWQARRRRERGESG